MAEPLSREEQDNILWALSCSNGGLDADGVRAYIAPWVATVQAAEERAEDWMRRGLAAVERAEKAEERAHHFLSALESARALIERDVPKEILLDNIRRNLAADDAKRGAA